MASSITKIEIKFPFYATRHGLLPGWILANSNFSYLITEDQLLEDITNDCDEIHFCGNINMNWIEQRCLEIISESKGDIDAPSKVLHVYEVVDKLDERLTHELVIDNAEGIKLHLYLSKRTVECDYSIDVNII